MYTLTYMFIFLFDPLTLTLRSVLYLFVWGRQHSRAGATDCLPVYMPPSQPCSCK